MKHLALSCVAAMIALLALTATANAAPAVGDQVIYHVNGTEDRTAIVTGIVSGTTVDLVALSNGTDYGDGNSWFPGVATYTSKDLGTSGGEYSLGTSVQDVATSVALVLPGAGSSSGLTLGGSGVQLSSTRPVLLTVRGTASMTSTLSGGQGYTLELRCDSGSTPTAVVDDATGSLTQTLGLSITQTEVQPVKLVRLVPAGHYCRVVQASGSATIAITGSSAQTL